MFLGNLAIYVVGVPWLMVATGLGLQTALEVGFWPFLIGDAMKLIVAAASVAGWLVGRQPPIVGALTLCRQSAVNASSMILLAASMRSRAS